MRHFSYVILMVLSLVSATSHANTPSHFSSIPEMIEDFNDYSADGNSFEMLSEKPVHFRLSPVVISSDLPEVITNLTRMAAIYGIYRPFIHTDVNAVTVTAVPIDSNTGKPLDSYGVTITKTRGAALKDIKKFFPVNEFSELTISSEYGNDGSSKVFNQIQYDDQGGVGITKFFNYISSENKG
ncbi:hypothetical protein [Serratia fonticola]